MKVLIAVLCLLVAGIQSKAETSEKKYEKTIMSINDVCKLQKLGEGS